MSLTQYATGAGAAVISDAAGNSTNNVILTSSYFDGTNTYMDPDVAIQQNATLVHEALHVALNLDDVALANFLSKPGTFQPGDSTQASMDIATYLASCFHY